MGFSHSDILCPNDSQVKILNKIEKKNPTFHLYFEIPYDMKYTYFCLALVILQVPLGGCICVLWTYFLLNFSYVKS